jgi:hypothetical protein
MGSSTKEVFRLRQQLAAAAAKLYMQSAELEQVKRRLREELTSRVRLQTERDILTSELRALGQERDCLAKISRLFA